MRNILRTYALNVKSLAVCFIVFILHFYIIKIVLYISHVLGEKQDNYACNSKSINDISTNPVTNSFDINENVNNINTLNKCLDVNVESRKRKINEEKFLLLKSPKDITSILRNYCAITDKQKKTKTELDNSHDSVSGQEVLITADNKKINVNVRD